MPRPSNASPARPVLGRLAPYSLLSHTNAEASRAGQEDDSAIRPLWWILENESATTDSGDGPGDLAV